MALNIVRVRIFWTSNKFVIIVFPYTHDTGAVPVYRKSMDSVDIVRLEYWNESPWTMSTQSMDNVH